MFDIKKAMGAAAAGMSAQSFRLRIVGENIANADTPGYQRKIVPFEEKMSAGQVTGQVTLGTVQLDKSERPTVFDPGHPMADENGHYIGSNVDLVVEIADAREAQRSYEANLKMFEQTRKMSSRLLDILRK